MSRFRMIEVAVAAALLAGVGGMVFAQPPAGPAAGAQAPAAQAPAAPSPFAAQISARRDFMKSIQAVETRALRGDDLEAAKAAALRLQAGFKALGSHFPEGSLSATESAAKADIFSKPDAWKAELAKAVAAADAVVAASASNDLAKIREASQGLNDTCRSCHSQFRGAPVA